MNSIFIRRSIRKFKNQDIEPEKLSKALKAAMQAPSAGNQQPWEFIVVDNKEILADLKNLSPYAGAIGSAPVTILVVGNKKFMRFPENWEQDLGAAVENLLIQAVEEGLGSVWLGISPLEDRITYVRNLLNLPENIIPFAAVPIGYPAENQENKFIDRFDEKRIHYNKY